MTSHILSTELTSIVQDARKKHADLRLAAEQSLQDLKAITVTSEAQLAADLRRRPRFISPFLLACKSKSPKSTLAAVSCLQRLTVNHALPKEHLQDVLEAFQDSVSVGLEVQLKILQALPSFLQNYGDSIEGDAQARVLQTCISLQQIKNAAVSNTASATLQQSVSSVFERVETEDQSPIKSTPVIEIETEAGSISVKPAAYDAYRTLKDICLITQGLESQYIRKATLPQAFGLELIETVLLNHAELMNDHKEFSDLLLKHVMPLVNQFLSERHGFPITVRAVRILCTLVREHLDTIDTECEIALGLLNHTLESETSQPWRRALCMEAFRVIYSNADLVVEVYSAFDQQKERGNVIQDNLGLFVRIASEKPALIGLGQHSSIPSPAVSSKGAGQDHAVAEAEAAAGILGSDFGVSENNVPGISSQWSNMKVSCLDQLDKTDGPTIPETYLYSLILTCINTLSDSLAKVVLPLSMHRGQKKSRSPARHDADSDRPNMTSDEVQKSSQAARLIPANPLDLKERAGYAAVLAVADLISSCWPAVLATASTFFNAALDAEFYRGLVRSFQKFTQVAGILRLSTPRDALLTTLAKIAVPPSLLSDITSSTPMSPGHGAFRSIKGLLTPVADGHQAGHDSPVGKPRQSSSDASAGTLTQRNLMCLRALTHLAIALGPILDQSWNIVLETLQKANVLIATSGAAAIARDYKSSTQVADHQTQPSLASEMAAVEGAVSKLMQTTNEYPADSFKILLTALCNVLASSNSSMSDIVQPVSPTGSQRRAPSVSGIVTSATLLPQYNHFAVAKLGDLARINLRRLAEGDPGDGWDLLIEHLRDAVMSNSADQKTKQMAADVIANVAAEASILTASDQESTRREVQQRSFAALKRLLHPSHSVHGDHGADTALDIHQAALGALRAILEHCGDAVITGWHDIFAIIDSVFARQRSHEAAAAKLPAKPVSAKLARAAFASVQLICSDFLSTLAASSYPVLIRILTKFCAQNMDMNISLSVITLFWNVSDHLRTEITAFTLPETASEASVLFDPAVVERLGLEGSVTASWLTLQQNIAFLTQDSRGDVRNGAVHVLFRTLNSTGTQLSGIIWQSILTTVLFKLVKIDIEKQSSVREQSFEAETAERKAMNSSSSLIIDNTAKMFLTFFDQLTSLPEFAANWHALLELFVAYIDCDSYALCENVFVALARILEAAKDLSKITPQAVNEVASLWARDIPKGDQLPENDASSRDKALLAYLKTLKQVHRLWKQNITEKQLCIVLQRLEDSVYASQATPYTNDLSKETDLQLAALQCLEMLKEHSNLVPISLLKTLAAFVKLPYKGNKASPAPQRLTFVAFAKSAMASLEDCVISLAAEASIYADSGLTSSLDAFAVSIERKYLWEAQGPEPSLWRKASSHALNILQQVLPMLKSGIATHSDAQKSLYTVVRLGRALQNAEYTERPEDGALISDETHDLAMFGSFKTMITPYLASPLADNEVRLAYVYGLFRVSTIHPSRHDDDGYVAADNRSDVSAEHFTPNLDIFKNGRLGRTQDPAFTPRIRMAYDSLDELFNLVSQQLGEEQKSQEAGPLARAAFSFVVLRVAVPLKRYIADQPLRGRMPMPASQRLELLYVLDRATDLQCLQDASASIGDNETVMLGGIGRPGKEHLRLLAPLVQHAMGCATGDVDVVRALSKVLAVIIGR